MRSEAKWLRVGPALLITACSCAKQAPPGDVAPSASAARPGGERAWASALASRPAASAEAPTLPRAEVTWSYPDTPLGKMSAVVVVPERRPDERFPVLLTFHGMGEARKGPERGARGWIDDYGLLQAMDRLAHPPLTAGDLQGLGDAERLEKLNHALSEQPYRGLIVVNSYTPDVLRGDEPFSKVGPLARECARVSASESRRSAETIRL